MTPITLTVPLPPNMANARMHWRTKHRERRAYFATLDLLLAARQLPSVPDKPLSPIRLDSTLYVGARHDDDNALARIKWAADFLKRAGYIRDDKYPHCRFTIPEQVVKRDGNYRLQLVLTPL